MTSAEATARALELWGRPAFARRISYPEKDARFVVGIGGPLTGEPLPLGVGANFEAAFAYAEREGYTRERVATMRFEAAKSGPSKWEAAADFVAECVRKSGNESPEFAAEARAFYEQQQLDRRAIPSFASGPVRFEVKPT